MIRYLRLSNFRRHVETELRFEDADQVVLVSGQNGVGKSTLFEAVLYALYGEGRNGRGNIERLVRKGAELEGMEVELHFEVGSDLYQVRRRRDTKLSSALLFANDVPLMEGSREVTGEVARLLGMDSKGFRVAAYAQQRELDGLASMRPADRGQMLSRLLRLDIVSRAKEAARAEFRQRRDVLRAMGEQVSVDEARTALDSADVEMAAIEASLTASRAAIATLDAEIAAGSSIEAAYQAAVTQRVRLVTLSQAVDSEVLRLRGEIDAIVVPDPIVGPSTADDQLRRDAAEIEQRIARGEQQQRQAQQLRMITGELARCETRLGEIESLLVGDGTAGVVDAATALEGARRDLEDAAAARGVLRERFATLRERLERAEADVARTGELGASCDACGQVVSDEHRTTMHDDATGIAAGIAAELDAVRADGAAAKTRVESCEHAVRDAGALLASAERRVEEIARLDTERNEVLRRRDVYREQVERLSGDEIDLTELYAERARVAVSIDLATQSRERALVREARLEQCRGLERALDDASRRAREHHDALEASAISTDLEQAHLQVQHHQESRSAELEILSSLQVTAAAATERRNAIQRDLERAEGIAARRATVDGEAQVAMWTGQVLEQVESSWAQQIRPSLEGTVSELVMRLSDGRFDAVGFDAEYNVSVRDRGTMRQITDLSGGEIDLVALAVRLGLSSIVSERHGAGGIGFLILDECFGSQDPARRVSIMNALRGLKRSHGQIFLISHVGGLEDAADAVVEVGLDDEANAVAVRE